jgi:hypothetical protein
VKTVLSTREVSWFLVLATVAVLGVTAWEVARGPAGGVVYAPAAAMLAILAAWPFLVGWRPLTPEQKRLRSCNSCGTEWRPADEGGLFRCPACGA